MALSKFTIPPQQNAYSVSDGAEVVAQRLDGGVGRYRKDLLKSSYTVSLQWLFSPADYEYFRAFYKSTTASGSSPFLIDLIIDTALEMKEYTAYFIPNKLRLSRVRGHAYTVSAQLEVQSSDTQDDADALELTLELYDTIGSDPEQVRSYINSISNLVNVDLQKQSVFNE